MHRSRLSVLTIFAAAAACSTRDDSAATDALSKDPSLVATLEVRQKTRQPLPDACVAVAAAANPASANKPQAEELAREAYDAELVGNTQEAHSLLLRASALDGTDKSAAYHLGRTSEAVGDRTGATTGYCRYLALAPTAAESVEARQRLARVSQLEPPAASVSIAALTRQPARVASARPAARIQSARRSRVASRAHVEQPMRTASAERGARPSGSLGDGGDNVSMQSDGAATAPGVDRREDRGVQEGDGVATSSSVPVVDQPSTASRTQRRDPSMAQSIGIGAIAGAIIGAAAGRSVKSAVLGAAAGGALGTVVGAARPAGRSMGSWAPRGAQPTGSRMARRPYYRLAPAA